MRLKQPSHGRHLLCINRGEYTLSAAIGFLPTTYLPRVNAALARAWRTQWGRKRLDAIFLSSRQIPLAQAMGWDEFGNFEEIPFGWFNANTLAGVNRAHDVSVLLPGDAALYANCLRAAQRIGKPTWMTWQESGLPSQRLEPGPLLAELTPSGDPPDYSSHMSFDHFWDEVDRDNRFTWILRLDAIGDILLTLSYLYPFKRRYPKRAIGLVVRNEYVSWLSRLDWIDKVCGVDLVYWERTLDSVPRSDGRAMAWLNLMPGMLRVAGNRILSQRPGLAASAYPDSATRCEFSPSRNVIGMRELLGLAFDGVAPELPLESPHSSTGSAIWFSPFPGADERLWPPDAWAQALAPLAGKRIVLQPSSKPLHRRWHAEFMKHANARGLKIEHAGPSESVLELIQMMRSARAWVGINSAPMHIAALIGLPSLALGLPWEVNAQWSHPTLQIVAAEEMARPLQYSPSPEGLRALVRLNQRSDNWADGLYLQPEVFASALRSQVFKTPCV
jgi:hypothetical protein